MTCTLYFSPLQCFPGVLRWAVWLQSAAQCTMCVSTRSRQVLTWWAMDYLFHVAPRFFCIYLNRVIDDDFIYSVCNCYSISLFNLAPADNLKGKLYFRWDVRFLTDVGHPPTGELFVGLDIAVATMKTGEVAKFLIKPEYAFGALGCPPRIPAAATRELYAPTLASVSGNVEQFFNLPVVFYFTVIFQNIQLK